MILNTMLGDNKKATDQSRENAGVHERSYLQKMPKGHVCILTWEGADPLTFWLDLMNVALPEFTEHLADLHGRGIFNEENPEKMLAKLMYDSGNGKGDTEGTYQKKSLIAIALPILPGKIEIWKTKMLERMLGDNKKDADAIRNAAGVRERLYLQKVPEGHIVILTFEGINPEAGYSQIIRNSPPEFAEAVLEIHGLDVNATQPTLSKLVYNSRE